MGLDMKGDEAEASRIWATGLGGRFWIQPPPAHCVTPQGSSWHCWSFYVPRGCEAALIQTCKTAGDAMT